MLRSLIFIGLGSFAGGILRYLTQQYLQKHFPSSFPLGTLAVNIIGCFVIGVVYGLSTKGNIISPEVRIFLVTGLCGGYTTFSSFAYENISLLQDGEFFYVSLYILLSVFLGFAATWLGILLIKII